MKTPAFRPSPENLKYLAFVLSLALSMTGLFGQTSRYTGTWLNTTFSSTGSVVFDINVSGSAVTLTFDSGGNVFGRPDPPPVTLNGTIGPNGVTFRKTADPNYGDITITLGLDGSLSLLFARIPVAGIDREEGKGTFNAQSLQFDFTVFFTNNTSARGRTTASRASGSIPQSLFFAQFGNGQGITSDVVLPNPTPRTVTGTVAFADDNGNPLSVGVVSKSSSGPDDASPMVIASTVDFSVPPLSAVTLSTDGLGNAAAGSAVVVSQEKLGGVVRFSLPGVGITGVGESLPLSGFVIPVRRRAGGINTGLAMRSTTGQSVNVTVILRRGTDEVGRRTLSGFAAGAHLAQFLNELFPSVNTDNFTGTLVVQVEGGTVAATALELGTAAGQFTTLPVTPLP